MEQFKTLPILGMTFKSVRRVDEAIYFDDAWVLEHDQDCSESVWIDDIEGDLSDLEGSPLLLAEEAVGTFELSEPASYGYNCEDEGTSATATFYKFATIKGYVDIRYSETAELRRLKNGR